MRFPNRLNTEDFAAAIANEADLSLVNARRFLAALCDVVTREMAAGNSIAVTNFGTWSARERPELKGRHPQTHELYSVKASQVVNWRTSPRLAQIVRNRDTTATTRKRPSPRHKQSA
jgi:DNA-binding protein HU-beta